MRYAAPEDQPPVEYQAPAPPPKKTSKLGLIIGAIVALGFLALCSGIILTAGDTPSGVQPISTSTIPHPSSGLVPDGGTDPTTDGPTTPAAKRPALADFKLTPKITSKECFGSAGCSIQFKVNLAYTGPKIPDEDEYELTYEVRGVEDGPLIGSLDMEGETYSVPEEFVSTSDKSKKITIKVTSVDKLGL